MVLLFSICIFIIYILLLVTLIIAEIALLFTFVESKFILPKEYNSLSYTIHSLSSMLGCFFSLFFEKCIRNSVIFLLVFKRKYAIFFGYFGLAVFMFPFLATFNYENNEPDDAKFGYLLGWAGQIVFSLFLASFP